MNISSTNTVVNMQKDTSLTQKKIENSQQNQDDKALLDACKEFESVFLYMMLKEMKKTVPDNGLVEKSQGTKMFEESYLEELAKDISTGGNGIGLAQSMYQQFKRGSVKL